MLCLDESADNASLHLSQMAAACLPAAIRPRALICTDILSSDRLISVAGAMLGSQTDSLKHKTQANRAMSKLANVVWSENGPVDSGFYR